MKSFFCCLSFCLVFMTLVFAESEDTTIVMSNKAFGLSFGRVTHYESYLSPILDKGFGISAWNETLKHKTIKNRDFYSLLDIKASFDFASSPSDETGLIGINGCLNYNLYYDWKVTPKFHMLCGGYAGFDFYNYLAPQNSNNVQLRVTDFTLLGLSVRPTLCLRSNKRLVRLFDQFNFRLAGIVYGLPTYTESLYNQYLSGYDAENLFDFLTLGNRISFSNKIMAEIPAKNLTWRFGVLTERLKSSYKMNESRSLNTQFLIGFSYDCLTLRGRLKSISNKSTKLKTVFE